MKNIYLDQFILNAYEITLKVNGTGTHNVISKGGFNNKDFPCPSKIYINNTEINISSTCYRINIFDPDSLIKLEWDNPLNSTKRLFSQCKTIREIDLTNFDTSLVTDMTFMFDDCIELKSIHLSNLNTSNVIYMISMFDGTFSLTSLNLSSFDTRKIKRLNGMFYNSTALFSIDLSSFNTLEVTDLRGMFENCEKLEYINLKNFEEINVELTTNIFKNIARNAVICLEQIKAPTLYDMADQACIVVSCEEDWRSVQKKIIIGSYYCYDDCQQTSDHKFEFKGKCYHECPENTTGYDNICYSFNEICPPNCQNCTIIDSDLNTRCTSCNEENNYYPKLNDPENIGGFINCYTGNVLGYFLENNVYKKCFETCDYRKGSGNETYHNCTKY